MRYQMCIKRGAQTIAKLQQASVSAPNREFLEYNQCDFTAYHTGTALILTSDICNAGEMKCTAEMNEVYEAKKAPAEEHPRDDGVTDLEPQTTSSTLQDILYA